MSLAQGVRLGPYEITCLLGAGGMGQVYKARDLRLQRDVAIKILQGEPSSGQEFHSRLHREAMAAAAVAHPHICTLYDMRQEGEASFLVMEYLEGETLAARLRRGPLSIPDVIVIGTEIGEALAAAHRGNLIHRDLKPGNIMLTRSGTKLLDFGLARIKSSALIHQAGTALTETDVSLPWMVMGTLQYMAPEQIHCAAIDHRTDIFAFGAVMYEMISGRPAFDGQGRSEIVASILRSEPSPLKVLRPEVPRLLVAVVKTCLAKEPEHRWQDAADLATALRAVGTDHGPRRPEPRIARPSPAGIRSLVVLPLEDAAGEGKDQYLADGMTESLIGSMSVIGGLKVISRASAMKYRASAKPLDQIAKELGVDGLIRGSVGLSDIGVRVNVSLLRPSLAEPIWSETYDRPLTDLFKVQAEIAETIAAEIHLRLTASERRRVRAHRVTLPEINEAYLRGRYYWNRETPDSLRLSYQYLSVALQRDPDYARAHAALADWYLSAENNGLLPVSEGIFNARSSALRALELDPGLAEAYACLGRVAMHQCDLQRARAEFETALRLNPNLVEPVIWSARVFSHLALHSDAIARVQLAKQLDPVSPRPYVAASAVYYIVGDFIRAIEEGRKALEFEPRLPSAFYLIGVAQLHLDRTVEALASLERAVQLGNGHAAALAGMAFALIKAGRREEALKVLDEMKERATRAEASPYYFAEIYMALGEVDTALAYLRRSYELRIPDIIGIAADPLFAGLHSHPEYQRIVHALGLPPPHA